MKEILKYLEQDIDTTATMSIWNAKEYLNINLAGSYDYYLVSILSEQFLLIKQLEILTIQKIGIHLELIHEKTNYNTVLLIENSTPYRIKKMLEEKIPFLEPGKQMYLPFLVLHLKNSKKVKREVAVLKKFTAATQLIFLAILYLDNDTFEVADMAKKNKLSEMTISRATTELESINLINRKVGGQTGRKNMFSRIDRKHYYSIGKEYLQNPISKIIYISRVPADILLYKSGLTALSEQTMLGLPNQEVYAIHSKRSKELVDIQVTKEQAEEEALPKVQLVKYDIASLTNDQYVDPVTLLLGLDVMDDRIEMAIDELMEDAVWYEG